MHCPNCGANAADNQKFCRGCGFGLEKVADLLAAHHQLTTPESSSGESLEARLVGWGISALLTVFGLGIAATIIKVVMIDKGEFWAGAGILAFLTGITLYCFLIGRWYDLQKEKERPETRTRLNAHRTDERLGETFSQASLSITEHTTDLLQPLSVNRRTSDKIKP